MRRVLVFCVRNVLFSTLLIVPAAAQSQGAQSLGELARQQRQAKKGPAATKMYTNENLPTTATINITGAASAPEAPAAKSEAKTDARVDAKADPFSPEDKQKMAAEYRSKVADQKKDISQLEREVDVAQREYKLRAAVFYSDAGTRLRDEKKWADEDRKYQADITAKQKELDAARQKLSDLQESARKSGLPPE